MTLLDSPTFTYKENGDDYVENTPEWKRLCEPLPCFDALEWPGYDAIHLDAEIDGTPVVIQLWKGWCQKFLGLQTFPGGIGAEVGIYVRDANRSDPDNLDFLPKVSRAYLQARLASVRNVDHWWPAPELATTLSFDVINPLADSVAFSLKPHETYWATKWMDEMDYLFRYAPRVGINKVPALPTAFVLDFTVQGRDGVQRWRWLPPRRKGDPKRGVVEKVNPDL